MRLTSQDKLALALTSYGSVRALSRDMGVSARTVTRWLREGETDDAGNRLGVIAIPDYASAVIDPVFAIHADLSREQARIDKLPFNKAAPVFTERKLMRDGNKGERAVAEHTQYIRPDLRVATIKQAAQSHKYLQASIRSRIDLKRYFKERAIEKIRERGWRMSPTELAKSMLTAFIEKEAREKHRIIVKGEPFALFTQYEDISSRRSDPLNAALGIENKLRTKHEPAIGSANTALADSFLFQLMPLRHEKVKPRIERSIVEIEYYNKHGEWPQSDEAKPRRASKARKRHIRGAGPK